MPTSEELLRAWFDGVWGRKDEAEIDRLLHADGRVHGLPGPDGPPVTLDGPAEFKPFYRAFRDAFPDVRIDLQQVVTQGEMAVAHCRVRGTHTGGGLGLPPTGHAVDFEGFAMCRVDGDKVREAFNCFDFLTMYRQLGAAPVGAAGARAAGA